MKKALKIVGIVFGALVALSIVIAIVAPPVEVEDGSDGTATTVEVVEDSTPVTEPEPEPEPEPEVVVLTVEEQLVADLQDELGSSDRDISPKTVVTFDAEDTLGRVQVRWAQNEALFSLNDTIFSDIEDVLRHIDGSDYDYSSVSIEVSYPLVDQLGNVSESDVVYAIWDRELIDQMDLDNVSIKTLFENQIGIVWMHNALR